jgi:hypothetical protein
MIDRTAMNASNMEDTILKLAELCPKLRELECWAVDDKGDDCKQIIISREGKEVKWKMQAPPSWYVCSTRFVSRMCPYWLLVIIVSDSTR